jgi:hypothetical protein
MATHFNFSGKGYEMLYNKNWDQKSTVKDTLNRAADLIEKYGHIKGQLGDRKMGMCANGAIFAAVGGSSEIWNDATNALGKHLGLSGYVRYDIPAWNNAPERTKEEVITAMRDAADAL